MAIILIRTLIIFLALIVAMRLMGKRQLGELELSELVAVLIADIASIPLQNPSLPLSYGLIPLLVLFCCELIFSGLTYKSIHLRKLLYGRPNFIIERGRIAQQAMHRNRFTLDELTQELRNQGILDIASVEYAVLETNGQLNIILAPAQQPVTAEQMHMETEDTGYFSILINNGRILRDNLKRMGRDERWLQKQVQQQCVHLSRTASLQWAADLQWMPVRSCGFFMKIRMQISMTWQWISWIFVREFTHSRKWVKKLTLSLYLHLPVQDLR